MITPANLATAIGIIKNSLIIKSGETWDTGISAYGLYILYDYTGGSTICYIVSHQMVVLVAETTSGASSVFNFYRTPGGSVKVTNNASIERSIGLTRL